MDYDVPRKNEDGVQVNATTDVEVRRPQGWAGVDEEDLVAGEGLELPGADLSGEELTIEVVPQQTDEFVCTRCFLVHHRSQLAGDVAGQPVCNECGA
ncbi:DUF4193 domain-containing protein [Georgenia yuyongxinii]|uniref:DUF4193 domain-containing protein n=1 Tax=Georgenia yuyongxinii TaxID=2589797 RepID=UPI001E63197B|nr:DUF4193 domain-containing protein [Georgenia yuyongxinii]